MTATKINKEELERLKSLLKEEDKYREELVKYIINLIDNDIKTGIMGRIRTKIKEELFEEIKVLVYEEIKSQLGKKTNKV